MQTEAAPKEPFTLGVLFRYKFTIFAVAVFVILGGYVRIITQPRLYEATARLAVKFTPLAITVGPLERDNLFRPPLLEEEVKAYMVQIRDQPFLNKVLDSLPADNEEEEGTVAEPTVAQRFRERFLKAYYDIRKMALSVADALLFTSDHVISEREQRVMQILSRLDVTSGTEASHIITVTYKNISPTLAANMVNAIAQNFIDVQKRKVKKEDEARYRKAVDDTVRLLEENRKRTFELANRMQSPTIEEAIRDRYADLDTLTKQKARFEVARKLLETGNVPYDRELGLESPVLAGELEREYFDIRMRFEEMAKHRPDEKEFFLQLGEMARKHIDERRKESIERDKVVTEAHIQLLDEQIKKITDDTTLAEVSPQYAQLTLEQTLTLTRLTKAEADLEAAKRFNEQLENENVSENIALWSRAQIPPFPLPQHRGIKLIIVIVLGIFAGCAAALLRHQIRPKPVRRPRPRTEEEVDVPLIILPDDGKRGLEKDLELDISFPRDDGAEENARR